MGNRLHQKVFEFFEDYRGSNPSFYYWLRSKNNKNRLENGIWFQGNEKYAFVGLYNRGGGTNMTRSFGLVFWENGENIACRLEVVFNEEKDKKILSFYEQARNILGGFVQKKETKYAKNLSSNNGFDSAKKFLQNEKTKIDHLIKENNLEELFISEESFNKQLSRVLSYQKKVDKNLKNYLLVNLSWNSSDWKEPSDDESNHKWVKAGNIPHESWNFDFDNPRNSDARIKGHAQFTTPPKVESSNNLIIFFSQNQIVGFYGKAEILSFSQVINDDESFNLLGEKSLSLVLKNKIQNPKEKGYLEDLQRVGQVGYSYLKKSETVKKIIEEAIELNPSDAEKLNDILKWLNLKSDKKELKMPLQKELNQILYGPPGTGKTYHTIKLAAEIITGKKYDNYDDAKKVFQDNLNEKIHFITFHQNYSYEDFVQGLKPDTNGDSELNFIRQDGIFKKICTEALFEYYKLLNTRSEDTTPAFDFETLYLDFVEHLKGLENKTFHTKHGNELFLAEITKNDNLNFKHSGGARKYGVSGDRLKKLNLEIEEPDSLNNINLEIRNVIGGCNASAYWVALKQLKKFKAEQISKESIDREVAGDFASLEGLTYEDKAKYVQEFLKENHDLTKIDAPNYVLIIDEINRANISRVFGELITLIEEDKRFGADNPLVLKLPSGDLFCVPPNLYIIGTMNTADKSIALIDVALRRRFDFVPMYPDYALLPSFGETLRSINRKIKEEKRSADFMIGHALLLSNGKEVSKDGMAKVINKKIIPLLNEYFQNRSEKVTEVLRAGGIELKEDDDNFLLTYLSGL
jgi:hypothetical protein